MSLVKSKNNFHCFFHFNNIIQLGGILFILQNHTKNCIEFKMSQNVRYPYKNRPGFWNEPKIKMTILILCRCV